MDIVSFITWTTKKIKRLEKNLCCLESSTACPTLSPDEGNILECRENGLYSAGAGEALSFADGNFTNFTGDGSPGDPFSIDVEGLDLQAVTDFGNFTDNPLLIQDALLTAFPSGEGGSVTAFGVAVLSGATNFPFSFGSVAIGTSAASNADVSRLTVVGQSAGESNTGSNLTAFGSFAGAQNSGTGVVMLGGWQNFSNNSGDNVIGIGIDTLVNNTADNVISLGSVVTSNATAQIVTLGWGVNTVSGVNNALYLKPTPTGSAQAIFSLGALTTERIFTLPDSSGTFVVGNVLRSLNTLTVDTQTFATGTTGTNFGISSSAGVHTFNLPDASATARGVITTGSQTIAGNKTFSGNVQTNGIQTNTSSSNSSFIAIGGTGVISPATADISLEGAATGHYRITSNGAGAILTANTSYATFYLRGTGPTEAATGTHPLIANIAIKSLTLVDGAGATTNTASIYVEGAMTGVTPTGGAYAIWSKAGQNRFGGSVGVGITTINAVTAALQVDSTTQGFLPPRMTAAQASAIVSPAEGLIVYVTDTDGTFLVKGWYGYNGTVWQVL